MERAGHERTLVLVKALPQPSETYGETVCVAGLSPTGNWRRLYPVRFRQLDEKFGRWQWVDYDWRAPKDDKRRESRHVEESSIKAGGTLKLSERARFLAPLIRNSVEEAMAQGESLTLIRPIDSKFFWEAKTPAEIAAERDVYATAADQLSFLDAELKALKPCPYEFRFKYRTADGKSHENFCHDWETTATFNKLSKTYGVDAALRHLDTSFNEKYPKAGMAFAMGTHSQRPKQWLLIGVLRLDDEKQASLF